jgi:tetratricopeptide (TPR) repeat protein
LKNLDERTSKPFTMKKFFPAATFIIPFVLSIIIFLPTVNHELVWDDVSLVHYTKELYDTEGIKGLVSSEFVANPDLPESPGYYRPLVLLSLWLDSRWVSFSPRVFHLTNILLHGVNTLLVTWFLFTFLGSIFPATAGGLVFALHPVHVESVAFVSGRTDLLASVFVLLTVILWTRVQLDPARRPLAAAFGGSLAFLAAVFCKEVAYTLPALLLAWGLFQTPDLQGQRTPWSKRNSLWLIPCGFVTVLTLIFRIYQLGIPFGFFGKERLAGDGIGTDFAVACMTWLTSIRLLLFPVRLNAHYTHQDVLSLRLLAGLSLLLIILLSILSYRRSKGRPAGFAITWFIVFFLPVSGIVKIMGPPIAERFLYLPSVALSMLAAILAEDASRLKSSRPWFIGTFLSILLLFCVATLERSRVWSSNLALFTDLSLTSPENPIAYLGIGQALIKEGHPERAIKPLLRANSIDPDMALVDFELGRSYELAGQREKALYYYRKAVHTEPDLIMAHHKLGMLLGALGRWSEALQIFRRTLELDPGRAKSYFNLGAAEANLGNWRSALDSYKQAVELDPDFALARYNLSLVYLETGDIEKAERELKVLKRLDKGYWQLLSQKLGRTR